MCGDLISSTNRTSAMKTKLLIPLFLIIALLVAAFAISPKPDTRPSKDFVLNGDVSAQAHEKTGIDPFMFAAAGTVAIGARKLSAHKVNGCNEALEISVLDE